MPAHSFIATAVDLFSASPIDLPGAELDLRPHWLDAATAATWFTELARDTPWEQPQLFIHGRHLAVPRLLAWYGDPEARYRYSGLEHQPLPWTPLLAEIRTRVQEACGRPFNAVLLNYYRDGNDSMGWHSDDEPELGDRPLIASLSLGATRRFLLRHRREPARRLALELEPGSLLLMGGDTQRHWKHALPRTARPVGERINLTFRQLRRSSYGRGRVAASD